MRCGKSHISSQALDRVRRGPLTQAGALARAYTYTHKRRSTCSLASSRILSFAHFDGQNETVYIACVVLPRSYRLCGSTSYKHIG
jgi:hypothetical protein